MANLRERALSSRWGRSPWCDEDSFLPATHATYRTGDGFTIDLKASIDDVQEILAKALKPNRSLVTAVRFGAGRIEEAIEPRDPEGGRTKSIPDAPLQEYWNDLHPDRAVTVAAPIVGCPMPVFAETEARASFVLEQFLTPDQVEDYRRYACFVSIGRDTGHRYMVIHRERPALLAKHQGRQLFDLEENRPMCVHDWEIPPPEEMLALHLCLSLPGREQYVRNLPATWHS